MSKIGLVWKLAREFAKEMFPEMKKEIEMADLVIGEPLSLRHIQKTVEEIKKKRKIFLSFSSTFPDKEKNLVIVSPETYLLIENGEKVSLTPYLRIIIEEFSDAYNSKIKKENVLQTYRQYSYPASLFHELQHLIDKDVSILLDYNFKIISEKPLKILIKGYEEEDKFEHSIPFKFFLTSYSFEPIPFEVYLSHKHLKQFYERVGLETFSIGGEALFVRKYWGVDVKRYLDAWSIDMIILLFLNVGISRERLTQEAFLDSLSNVFNLVLPSFLASRYLRAKTTEELYEFIKNMREINPEKRVVEAFIKMELRNLYSFVDKVIKKYGLKV